jgi:hypothetical protein
VLPDPVYSLCNYCILPKKKVPGGNLYQDKVKFCLRKIVKLSDCLQEQQLAIFSLKMQVKHI